MNHHQITSMKAKILLLAEQQQRVEEMQKFNFAFSETTKYLYKVIDAIKGMI